MSEPATETLDSKLSQLYRHRFPEDIQGRRRAIWKILCTDWFERWIPPDARVVEVGAGYCEFINAVSAAEKVGIDLNPESRLRAASDVTIHLIAAERMAEVLPANHFDVVFMSNFLEHCATKNHVLDVLRAARAVLKPGGRVLILGPNFR
jgi:SAM-dependent methyltransferase